MHSAVLSLKVTAHMSNSTLQTVPNWAKTGHCSVTLLAVTAVPSASLQAGTQCPVPGQCHLMAGTAVPSAGQCLKKTVQKSPKTNHLK